MDFNILDALKQIWNNSSKKSENLHKKTEDACTTQEKNEFQEISLNPFGAIDNYFFLCTFCQIYVHQKLFTEQLEFIIISNDYIRSQEIIKEKEEKCILRLLCE